MAVALDSVAENTGTTSVTVSTSPVGTIRGCLVFVSTLEDDDVTGVTADGNAMTEVASSPVESATGGEDGAVGAWFYGGNLGGSAFNVVVTAGSNSKWVGVICLTAASDTQVQADDANFGSADDPTATLALSGVESFAAVGWYSVINADTNITPNTGWSEAHKHDFGDECGGMFTYDTVGTSDVTYGITTSVSNEYAMLGVAISEAAAASGGMQLVGGVGLVG